MDRRGADAGPPSCGSRLATDVCSGSRQPEGRRTHAVQGDLERDRTDYGRAEDVADAASSVVRDDGATTRARLCPGNLRILPTLARDGLGGGRRIQTEGQAVLPTLLFFQGVGRPVALQLQVYGGEVPCQGGGR